MHKFLFCLLALTTVTSYARVNVSAVFVPTYNYPTPTTNRGGVGVPGGGLLFEIGGSKLGFELGALYETQVLNSVTSSNIAVPVSLRIHPMRILTFSVGGYVDYQLTNLPVTMNALDYGARATVGAIVPLTKSIAFMIEVGFRYGFANLAKAGSPTLNQMQGLGVIGLRFGDSSKK